jgi:Fe2+ transport system protein FeoA
VNAVALRATVALDRVPAGTSARLVEPDAGLDKTFREHLAAYGVVPGHDVTVLAQKPMTVVLCDHVELALEAEVARRLRVEYRVRDEAR